MRSLYTTTIGTPRSAFSSVAVPEEQMATSSVARRGVVLVAHQRHALGKDAVGSSPAARERQTAIPEGAVLLPQRTERLEEQRKVTLQLRQPASAAEAPTFWIR